jgi:hypothetical protein
MLPLIRYSPEAASLSTDCVGTFENPPVAAVRIFF